jgi:hypothetical protein
MLIRFSVANFMSFHQPTELDLSPSGSGSDGVSPLAALYGANGAGKSNLFRAFQAVRRLACCEDEATGCVRFEAAPFRFDPVCEGRPARFSLDLSLDEGDYRYSLEADRVCVLRETLERLSPDPGPVFERRSTELGTDIVCQEADGLRVELASLAAGLPPLSLLAPVAARAGHAPSRRLVAWFERVSLVTAGPGATFRQLWETLGFARSDRNFKDRLVRMAARCGFGLHDLVVRDVPFKTGDHQLELLISERDTLDAAAVYDLRGVGGGLAAVDIYQESEGLKHFLGLAGQVLRTLERDGLLLVDDLDGYLHPLGAREIVRLFVDGRTSAQLVFSGRETSLLEGGLLQPGELHVVSLAEDRSSCLTRASRVADGGMDLRRVYLGGLHGVCLDGKEQA